MGLWSKMKGVFSRIGSGIKKGFDWLTKNRDRIESAATTAAGLLPEQYQDKARQMITSGGQALDKAQDVYNRLRT